VRAPDGAHAGAYRDRCSSAWPGSGRNFQPGRPGRSGVLGALAILGGFLGFGALFDSLKRGDGIGLWIFGGVSLVVLAGVGYMRWINLSSAPRRVFFHEAEPEERPKRKRTKKARKADAEVDVAP
jgi:hypothetical protein